MVRLQSVEEVPRLEAAAEEAVATLAVCLDHQDLLAILDVPDVLANLELPVFPATQESHRYNLASPSPHHHANHAHKDLPDHQDHLAHPEMLANPDNPETQAPMHHLANQDQKDHQDLLVSPANPDPLANPEHQHNQRHPSPARLDPQETLDHPDHQDLLANLETMRDLDQLDQRDHPDPPAHLATMVSPERLDNQDSLVLPARKVFAPSIAPSTVECSSRMALADVKPMGRTEDWSLEPQIQLLPPIVSLVILLLLFTNANRKII